ncbi:hypothetical protein [Megasphaera vaginalis (ex Bordigoni et al. 2020)]|uniref:hypothetical protein n=2 Tax=Megasphaera TaxID=906 RepID=UPI0011AF5FEC|nr:hypothetical protein [Megasphaera vaginalis (ex Bordigoni et al. 2020)]
MWNRRIACVMAVIALCGTVAAGAADYSILEKAEKVETTVYGSAQSGALNDRIASLDKELRGGTDSSSAQARTDAIYKEVYGNSGADLSMLAAVNMMQWKYAGKVTDEPLLVRVSAMEQGLNGAAGTGPLRSRIASLRTALLGNKKYTSQRVTIPAGTLVKIRNLDAIDSAVAAEGEVVHFSVSEDVMVGDVVVIPRGMDTNGTITKARKAGRFGRDGKIEISYDSVRGADGSPIPLVVGEKTKEEYKRTAGAVGASAAGAIVLGPVGLVGGLFVKGNNVEIPAGTEMYVETKAETEVVGFKEGGAADDMYSADLAASGVSTTKNGAVPVTGAEPAPADNGFEKLHRDIAADTSASSGDVVPVNLETTEGPVDAGTVVKITPTGN